jgi:hypothetical protein
MMDKSADEQTARLMTALEHERITGPVRAAHFAGERAYQIARTQAAHPGESSDEAHARGKLAFWVAYFTDLAEEAAVRAEAAWEEARSHGDERLSLP